MFTASVSFRFAGKMPIAVSAMYIRPSAKIGSDASGQAEAILIRFGARTN